MLNTGERQVAARLEDIRRDHVARYEWAAKLLGGKKVIDAGCGIGYGSKVLADAGCMVTAFDASEEAINYAREHYDHDNVRHLVLDAEQFRPSVRELSALKECDAAVCFEVVEHVWNPATLLRELHRCAPMLLVSVPNEDEFPWDNVAFHHRHYTSGEFETLLNACGWEVVEWYGQHDAGSDVEKNLNGRTIIAVCQHRAAEKEAPQLPTAIELNTNYRVDVPEHVAILGLGPSVSSFLEFTKRIGGRSKFCDEVWGINAIGDVIACDRVFHMDDIRIQEIRAAAKPESNIATLVSWLKKHPGPVYTSRPHPDYPGLVPYPLEYVARQTGYTYMNNTAAHAVAFAVAMGVKKLSLFGMDFTYAHSHHAEKGRACVEFWIGYAAARGIKISIPQKSSLMDGCEPDRERPYGYDTIDVRINRNIEGLQSIQFFERETIPTAEEIEKRYDHSAHPNPLVKQ